MGSSKMDVENVGDGAGSVAYMGTSAGSATVYTLTNAGKVASLVEGQIVVFKAHLANTGASTLNVNALGAKAIQSKSTAIGADVFDINTWYALVYDGTVFQVINPA